MDPEAEIPSIPSILSDPRYTLQGEASGRLGQLLGSNPVWVFNNTRKMSGWAGLAGRIQHKSSDRNGSTSFSESFSGSPGSRPVILPLSHYADQTEPR